MGKTKQPGGTQVPGLTDTQADWLRDAPASSSTFRVTRLANGDVQVINRESPWAVWLVFGCLFLMLLFAGLAMPVGGVLVGSVALVCLLFLLRIKDCLTFTEGGVRLAVKSFPRVDAFWPGEAMGSFYVVGALGKELGEPGNAKRVAKLLLEGRDRRCFFGQGLTLGQAQWLVGALQSHRDACASQVEHQPESQAVGSDAVAASVQAAWPSESRFQWGALENGVALERRCVRTVGRVLVWLGVLLGMWLVFGCLLVFAGDLIGSEDPALLVESSQARRAMWILLVLGLLFSAAALVMVQPQHLKRQLRVGNQEMVTTWSWHGLIPPFCRRVVPLKGAASVRSEPMPVSAEWQGLDACMDLVEAMALPALAEVHRLSTVVDGDGVGLRGKPTTVLERVSGELLPNNPWCVVFVDAHGQAVGALLRLLPGEAKALIAWLEANPKAWRG